MTFRSPSEPAFPGRIGPTVAESAPHWPLIVPFSQSFVDFDPGRIPNQLTQSFYEQTYRTFLLGLETAMSFGKTAGGSTS